MKDLEIVRRGQACVDPDKRIATATIQLLGNLNSG